MRVFISSTSEDLKPYRLAVADVVRDAQWEPIGMEHLPADPRPIVQLCRETIEACEFVILLQAWRSGWVPPIDKGGDGQRSITALEVAAAEGLPRPILAFLADDNWPGKLWDREPTARERAERFRNELNRNAKVFRWEDDPKLPLFRALLSQELANYRNAGKPRSLPVGALDLGEEGKLVAVHYANEAFLSFTVSNLSNTPQKVALALDVLEVARSSQVALKKAGAILRDFDIDASLSSIGRLELLAGRGVQVVLAPGHSDAFRLRMKSPQGGKTFKCQLSATLRDVATQVSSEIVSKVFTIDYPHRSASSLLGAEDNG